MKLAVTGKGGVGKTTLSALLAQALAERRRRVIAIDADPDANLAACLGHPRPESIRPLVELKDLIAERTGVEPGTTGGMFRLNPFVADIPERCGVDVNGVRVLVAGAVKKGGSGCYCPENALLRALVGHLFMDRETELIIDMEAGIEHLGRGTISDVDRLLIVVDSGRRGIETAHRIRRLAADIGMTKMSVIGNRIRSADDERFVRQELSGMDFAGFVPYDGRIAAAERNGLSPWKASGPLRQAVAKILDDLKTQQETE